MGLSELHHFRFFQRNGRPHVQYKIYANDAWGPTDGHPFLHNISDVRSKLGFAEVFESNEEEVAALHSFVNMKERQLIRHSKLNAIEEQLQPYRVAIVETKAFIEYLERFPSTDRTSIHASSQFWWTLSRQNDNDRKQSHMHETEEEMVGIFSYFPAVEHRGYFGPRGQAPRKNGVQRPQLKRKRNNSSAMNTTTAKNTSTSKDPISNVVPMERQRWYDFDPHMDVHIGDFVGVQAQQSTQKTGEVFWIAKVRELRNVAREDGEFLTLWYWPTTPKGLRIGPGAMRTRYVNCLTRTWEPDRMYKAQDWIPVSSMFVSWTHVTKLKSDLVTVQGYRMEKKISIPGEQHSHFQNHLSLVQDIGSDDDHEE
jgi:hypothetical protein